ncbi:trichohyalin-plectin-homology domain domain-containing protein [Polaromonas sp. P1-6]|nr:trichohyalin-plectin-homology domain domain-containing protein [Polaromonas sp. P1-6]
MVASLLAILLVLPGAAWAQMPGPYGAAIDPPGRVARLNLVEGAVSFAPADAAGFPEANAWTPALLNRPLTSGDRLWTGPRARSELHIGSTAVRMNEQTSLDFLTLDDNTVQLRLAQGTIRLRVRTLFEGQRLEVNTPNLAFVMTQPGDYRLDANPISNITRVVVLSGAGVIYGDGGETVNLGNQQQANFTGTQLTPAGPGAAVQDSFDAWAAERDRREDQSVSARYIPRETLGYQQLDSYGDWRHDATYGAVWLPRAVPVHWAPYRVGHWSWIAPWGWTWIDDAPWGFAPFHYGRWAQIGPRWAWVPGRLAPRPVYAPALVAFIGGNSGGVHWSISIGSGGTPRPSLGWFPLAPDEPFRPAYRVSPRYVTEVNHNIVVNNTVNVTNIYRYQRLPAAVTAVSRDDFSRGRPVRGDLTPLNPADLSRAQVVTGGLAEGAANRGALPQRPDFRERPRPAAAAALPPAAVVVRPVVGSREERREDRRDDRRDARRDERPQDRGGDPRAQMPVPAAPAAPVVPPRSPLLAPPDASRSPLATPQDRPAIDAENRARREQQQLQRDQERQQGALTRQQDAQRRQAEESLGQRALREQAQKNGNAPPPTSARPTNQDAQAAAERSAAEQAQRASSSSSVTSSVSKLSRPASRNSKDDRTKNWPASARCVSKRNDNRRNNSRNKRASCRSSNASSR